MNERAVPSLTGRMLIGALLVLFGLLFLLDNLGYMDAGAVLQFWPMILVGLGTWKVLQPREDGQRAFGVALLAIGIFLQLQMLITGLRFRHIWPALLIGLGGLLIWKAIGRTQPRRPLAAGSAELHELAFMGGGNRIIDSPDFRGGDVTAIMGGLEIDLRKAGISSEAAVIDIFTLWGGIEFRVPEDWSVDVQATAIMGAFENKARASAVHGSPDKRLVIRGVALMGGVEVKN
jgi:predicted membrane protein